MTQPITVVITIHSGATYLAAAIERVLALILPAHEIIVVDDGSTDGSAAVAASFGPPIHCIRQHHQGPGAARNASVTATTGALLAFLDADDLCTPDKLHLHMGAMHASPEIEAM